MNPHCPVLAFTPAQLSDAQRLRYQVYVDEERMLQPERLGQRAWIDPADAHPATAHVLVYAGDQAVGTVRLSVLTAGAGAVEDGLSLEKARLPFEVKGLPSDAVVGLVERFCVLRRYRGTNVTQALYQGLRDESRRRGVTHWLAAANTETNCPIEAAMIYRVAAARGLVSDAFATRGGSTAATPARCSRHVYDPAQRRQGSAAGMSVALPLPRTLALFARRMGGRYVGRPIFEPTFGVFAIPLVAALA